MKRIPFPVRRGLSGILVAALVVSVAFPAQANAATKSTQPTHHSVLDAMLYARGKSYGPNAYSDWGKATIKSFTVTTSCGHTYYGPQISVKQYQSPAWFQFPAVDTATSTKVVDSTSCSARPMSPDSWWNPLSWNWSHILGSVWNGIVGKCVSGAAQGVVGTASGTLIFNLLTRGAKFYVGPDGYAVLAIGGCIVNVVF